MYSLFNKSKLVHYLSKRWRLFAPFCNISNVFHETNAACITALLIKLRHILRRFLRPFLCNLLSNWSGGVRQYFLNLTSSNKVRIGSRGGGMVGGLPLIVARVVSDGWLLVQTSSHCRQQNFEKSSLVLLINQ